MDVGQSQTVLLDLLQNPFIIILIIWEVVWKGVALWKAARYNQLYWFIAIIILNTGGLLSILYLIFFQKKKTKEEK